MRNLAQDEAVMMQYVQRFLSALVDGLIIRQEEGEESPEFRVTLQAPPQFGGDITLSIRIVEQTGQAD